MNGIDLSLQKKKIIYVAGKITGECETPELMKKCFEKFKNYCNLSSFASSHICTFGLQINRCPTQCEIGNNCDYCEGMLVRKESYDYYMNQDVAHIAISEEVHFLPDWIHSKGSIKEHLISMILKKTIIYPDLGNERGVTKQCLDSVTKIRTKHQKIVNSLNS